MKKQYYIYLLILSLIFTITGCHIRVVDETQPSFDPAYADKTISYGYHIEDFEYVDSELRYYLNKFGEPEDLMPVAVEPEVFTDIPVVENNAKGTDSLCIIFPDLNHAEYLVGKSWTDQETGYSACPYYRTVSGVVTDECIVIYIDDIGTIHKYETYHLGMYDFSSEEVTEIISLQNRFKERMDTKLHSYIFETMSPTVQHAPSNFSLFTDSDGRLVISTTVVLKSDKQYLKVDLYGILDT